MDEKNDARHDGRDDAARPGEPRIVEGPSATTDPDNSRSGNAAYVIFGVAAVVLALLVLTLSSCVASLAELGGPRAGWGSDDHGVSWRLHWDASAEGPLGPTDAAPGATLTRQDLIRA